MASFLGGILGGIGNAAEAAVKVSPYLAQQMAAQKALDLQRSQIALNQYLAQEENRRANQAQGIQLAMMGLTPDTDTGAPAAAPQGGGGPPPPPLTSPPSSLLPPETPGVDSNGMPTVPPVSRPDHIPEGPQNPPPPGMALQQAAPSPAPPIPPPSSAAPPGAPTVAGGMGGFQPPAPMHVMIGGKSFTWNPMTPAVRMKMFQDEYENAIKTRGEIAVSAATGATAEHQHAAAKLQPGDPGYIEYMSSLEQNEAAAKLPAEVRLAVTRGNIDLNNGLALANRHGEIEQTLAQAQRDFDAKKITQQQFNAIQLEGYRQEADYRNRLGLAQSTGIIPNIVPKVGGGPGTAVPSRSVTPPTPPPFGQAPPQPTAGITAAERAQLKGMGFTDAQIAAKYGPPQ